MAIADYNYGQLKRVESLYMQLPGGHEVQSSLLEGFKAAKATNATFSIYSLYRMAFYEVFSYSQCEEGYFYLISAGQCYKNHHVYEARTPSS